MIEIYANTLSYQAVHNLIAVLNQKTIETRLGRCKLKTYVRPISIILILCLFSALSCLGRGNHQPTADAGSSLNVDVGDTVELDGSNSSDGDGDTLTYIWSITSMPQASAAELSDSAAVDPSFVADVEGNYTVQLVVNDGNADSDPDSVPIHVGEISGASMIIDHRHTDINQIPESWITTAKEDLHVVYGHTSHGSQIITGMNGLDSFMSGTGLYAWNDGPLGDALDIDDYFVNGDLGNPDRTTWADRTRTYLDDTDNSDVNIVMWSWCGQAATSTDNIDIYLNLMEALIADYPDVSFVFMTGHLDGAGLSGDLHLANEYIRNHCIANDRILYDFADIESYDPDDTYYGDKVPNDNCDYDSDADGTRDKNWATEWQDAHPGEWYSCSSAHSQPLNANMKAYAAWWLWARLVGWDGV